MVAIGYISWCAFTNSKICRGSNSSPERTRQLLLTGSRVQREAACFRVAAGPAHHVLTSSGPMVTLRHRVGLDDPVANRHRRRLELLCEVFRTPTGQNEVYELLAELRWIWGTSLGHGDTSFSIINEKVSTKPGPLQRGCCAQATEAIPPETFASEGE